MLYKRFIGYRKLSVLILLGASCFFGTRSALGEDDLGFIWTDRYPEPATCESSGEERSALMKMTVNGAWGDAKHDSTRTHRQARQSQAQVGVLLLKRTTTAMPVGRSFECPSSFALRAQGTRTKLPPTQLDSFVFRSTNPELIYGNEGTSGPPPFDTFGTIESGLSEQSEQGLSTRRDLTTGHSDRSLPSAWY